MSWFCSGYSPRRFILGIVRGLFVDRKLARVWKPRGDSSWHWITFLNTFGRAKTYQKAMDAAETSLEQKLGGGS